MNPEPNANPFQSPANTIAAEEGSAKRASRPPNSVLVVVVTTYLITAYLVWIAGQGAWDGYQMLFVDNDVWSSIFGEIVLGIAAICAFAALAFGMAAFGMHCRKRWGRILALFIVPLAVIPLGMGLADQQLPGPVTVLPAIYGIASFIILWTKNCRDYFRPARNVG
ncbi:hypothetical protein [Blastopirellula marina]|uniref:Uncharacterized protein n=1 Tax=Blastopirellula marina TaxID=124 RepID=A0A2S8GU08_9BACT|nr:hypothetical protein [Blastopirellula marina]PQO47892.1 hypothetical protein C5Y93_02310 [Blastopirellula marina]